MGNRIKELRQSKGISQSELAQKVGISNQAISYYETGKRHAKIETWQKLADYFDVSVPYLQGFEMQTPNRLKELSIEIENGRFAICKAKFGRKTYRINKDVFLDILDRLPETNLVIINPN